MQTEYSEILSKEDSMMSDSLRTAIRSAPNSQLDATIACLETGIELAKIPILNFSASRTGCELQLELSRRDMQKIQDSFHNTCVVKCLNYSKSANLHKYKIEKSLSNMLLVTLEFTDY